MLTAVLGLVFIVLGVLRAIGLFPRQRLVRSLLPAGFEGPAQLVSGLALVFAGGYLLYSAIA